MRPGFSVVLLLLLAALAGCTWTMSSAQRQRVSDCLARCDAMGQQDPGRRPVDPQSGFVDQRSESERQCHALR